MTQTTYSNPRMEVVIDNWPLGGSRRGQAVFAIETVAGRGQRATRFTINNGKPSAVKKLTYAPQARIVDGSDGKTYLMMSTIYGFVSITQGGMQFQAETIHIGEPRWQECMELLGFPLGYIEHLRTANAASRARMGERGAA